MVNRRTAGLALTSATGSPVADETPLTMPFSTSFDQRSPHRLVVGLAESTRENRATNSSMRVLTRPWTSPARNTVWRSPILGTVRITEPAAFMSTEIMEAMAPTVRPQPTMPAMRSSLRQFWRETT